MNSYQAPIKDIMFALTKLADLNQFSEKTNNKDLSFDNIKMILDEAGKFATEKLDTINQKGDQDGVTLENGVVRMPDYFIKAYKEFVKNGWFTVIGDKKYGGQDMPISVLVAINEIWESANMSFAVNNMLTQGAIELIQEHGSEKQKTTNLPKLITGEWSGTMNLTEPHAGSDLSTLKTKAEKSNSNKYLIKGTKIYITHGDQDMTENIREKKHSALIRNDVDVMVKLLKEYKHLDSETLDKMLESIQLNRTNVYISNVVNYRPPENRKPTDLEIKRYLPYLKRHIEIIDPKILVLLGSTALNTVIGGDVVISKARGKWVQKEIGAAKPWTIVSFHPAFLMRQPAQKKMAWIDLKMIRDKKNQLKI